ncbi:MAG: hypothetical protein DHS20C04_02800 [Hyphococcus sp.]|nr:MAG: hypothetical protein DHS20C04_02800 [Marinicaulis sp.]
MEARNGVEALIRIEMKNAAGLEPGGVHLSPERWLASLLRQGCNETYLRLSGAAGLYKSAI